MSIRFALSCLTALVLSVNAASAQRSIAFSDEAGEGGLIIAVSDVDKIASAAGLSAEASANIMRAIEASGFEAEEGAVASYISGDAAIPEIHLIGVKSSGMRARDWQDFGGRAAELIAASKTRNFNVIADNAAAASLADAALGAALGQYSFLKYKSEAEPATGTMTFVSAVADSAASTWNARKRHLADAVRWTRDMQSEPANIVYPEEFVRRARDQFRGVANVTIDVLDENDMRRMGMGAILGVGQGSARPPRILVIHYRGAAGRPIVFAGKGITFDSGGISIKPNTNMWMMKADMTGAAAVTGAVMSLARSQAPVNVIAIAALAENMPDGRAQRPGDVVRTMSGKTVEIMSTDAEGRLVLSDAVWYAQEQFNPRLLVDVATLTGSVGRALGDEYAGLFVREDAIADALLSSGRNFRRGPLATAASS